MDEQSDDTKEEEVMGEGIGESETQELVPVWGWRRDEVSWFQRQGEAYRKERWVTFKEDDEGGRARVTTDEERVLKHVERRWNYDGMDGCRVVVRTLYVSDRSLYSMRSVI